MAMISLPGRLAPTRRFSCGVPGRFTVASGGNTVLFLRSRAGDDPVACLWALDLHSGAERALADPAQLLGASPRTGINAYATDADAGLVAFALAGGLWTVDVAGGPVRRLPVEGPVEDPRPDPAGRRIAYVRDGALRVVEADGAGDRAIAVTGEADVTFGVAEEAGALIAPRGHWWAPDGERLLVARVDHAQVGVRYVADPAEPAATPRTVRYAAAGTANAEVTLWIAGLDGSRTLVRWDALEYVTDAGWDGHGPYAVVQSRDQRTVRFLTIDPACGTRILSEQRDERWVHLVSGLPARTGSGALVGHRDLRGTRHLTVDGVTVTPPGLQLRAVLDVDGEQVL